MRQAKLGREEEQTSAVEASSRVRAAERERTWQRKAATIRSQHKKMRDNEHTVMAIVELAEINEDYRARVRVLVFEREGIQRRISNLIRDGGLSAGRASEHRRLCGALGQRRDELCDHGAVLSRRRDLLIEVEQRHGAAEREAAAFTASVESTEAQVAALELAGDERLANAHDISLRFHASLALREVGPGLLAGDFYVP